MDELLELCLKRIEDLEKKLEKYYHLLEVKNELDFILKGSYIFEEDVNSVLSGNYLMQGEEPISKNPEDSTTDTDSENSDTSDTNSESDTNSTASSTEI